MRTKVYAILELWVQVCGTSAGVLQGGASGEALLTHLLSDISPSADALKVSAASARPPVAGCSSCTPIQVSPLTEPRILTLTCLHGGLTV